ncbi:MAG: S9 family peptidase [Xanthomonadales bacterium]|nr:S9 family peptidase [Xanthomonadales bacterium]
MTPALRTALLPLLLVSALGACSKPPEQSVSTAPAPAPVEPARQIKQYDIDTLLSSLRLQGADFSPDASKVLFSSNVSGVINLYEVPAAGGEPTPLTQSTTDSNYSIGYFPNDGRILYTADQGGNELNHVYVRELDGSVKDLTPGDKFKAQFAGFADDKQSFFIATNERDERYFDLYEYAVDGYARSLFFKNDSGFFPGNISRDKKLVTLIKANTTSDSDIYLHDLASGKMRNLTEHEGIEQNDSIAFTPEGQLLIGSNRDGEFSRLLRLDLESGERKVVYETNWDVAGAEYSPDDRFLLVYINADARTELKLLDAKTYAEQPLPRVPAGDITGVSFSRDASKLAFYVASSRFPSSLWTADLGGEARQLVSALNPAVNVEDLVEGEVVRFASYDGLEIPGILYLPHGASAAAKVPAMVWVHGGPGGQSRLNYSPLVQYLVNHGYAVYAINNRGSSGYGKSFYAADDRRHGEADLDDVVESKKMLIGTGMIDASRIGIIGGSYGGYMTLAALSFRPDAFAVGVDIFGVANWLRTLESIPAWWEAQRAALYAELGDPVADKERLMRISPLFHASNINKPLMVLQGANDPRVLKVESDEIVAAVKANNVPVEYVVFPDEGHGFRKRENEKTGYEAILKFLDTHLKAKASP